jgi:hypothetical protein
LKIIGSQYEKAMSNLITLFDRYLGDEET